MSYVILSGLPASGKSLVALALSPELGYPVIDKDDILERLFDQRGIGDASWRSRLSREADAQLEQAARQEDNAILVSWWRHPIAHSPSGTPTEWLASLPGRLVELHCRCDPATAAHRFTHRRRHVGHLDSWRTPAELREEFVRHAALGALGIGTLATVECDREIDLPSLVRTVGSALEQPGRSLTK